MNLQIRLEPAVRIANLGDLAIVGVTHTRVENEDGTSESGREVTFLLVTSVVAPLSGYLRADMFNSDRESLLTEIFRGQGREKLDSQFVGDDRQILIFTRTVRGELRNSHSYLHATARKLAGEIESAEDADVFDQVTTDGLAFAEHHLDRPMPDFTRPCHEATVTEE